MHMESVPLTLLILASVLVGALLPLIVMLATAAYRAGREIAEVGVRLKRTLAQVEIIAGRVEVLSRGLEGGETKVAELMTSVGSLARGLDRTMKAVSVFSTIAAAAGSAVAAYLRTRTPAGESGKALDSDAAEAPGDGAARAPAPASPAPPSDAH